MSVARGVPIARIAVQPIGQLLPHESGVPAGWSLAWVKACRTGSPHDGRRNGAGLVMADQIGELVDMIEPHDHHEATVELRPFRRDLVPWRFAEVEIKCEKRRNEIVLEVFRLPADRLWHVCFIK